MKKERKKIIVFSGLIIVFGVLIIGQSGIKNSNTKLDMISIEISLFKNRHKVKEY